MKKERTGASMPNWAKKILELTERSALAALVDETLEVKKRGVEDLEEYDLSRYNKIEIDVAEFLNDPEKTFVDFISPTGKYYISLTDRVGGGREHALDVKQEDVVAKIQYLLNNNGLNPETTTLILSEYWRNDFSASVTVANNGERIKLEMVRGKHTGLTDSNVPLLLEAREDEIWHLLRFKLSEELQGNISLVSALKYLSQEILNQIPRQTDLAADEPLRLGVERPRLVDGYYEVTMHFDDDTDEYLIFFIDSRTEKDGEKYISVNMDSLREKWVACDERMNAKK